MKIRQLLFSHDLIGAEIGGEYLKLCHFKKTSGGIELSDVVYTDIHSSADDDIITFIQHYLSEHHIATRDTVTFVSPRYTINKNIELPSTDPTEIQEIIKLQASRYTPYSKDEIVINYVPIGVFKGGYTKILLVIVNKDTIKRTQDILERSGLRIKKMLAGQQIITQWAKEIKGVVDDPYGVIHVDYGNVDFMVIQKGKEIFVRSIPVGAYQLTTEPFIYKDKFISEIKSSLESYQLENIDRLKSIIFTGSIDSLNDEIVTMVSEKFSINTEKSSYIDNPRIAKSFLAIQPAPPKDISFLPIFNLASYWKQKQLLDLTPDEIKLREDMAERSRDIIITGSLIMLILIIGASLALKYRSSKETILKSLQEYYATRHPEAEALKKQHKNIKSIRKYLVTRTHAVETLTALHKIIPETIYLTSIVFEEEKAFSLEGIDESNNGADTQLFIDSLGKLGLFKTIEKKRFTRQESRGPKGEQKIIFEIQIVCTFE